MFEALCFICANKGNDYGSDSSNIIFTTKYTYLFVPVVILSGKDNQKLIKRLSKIFEKSSMKIKKIRIKIEKMCIDAFSNQTL